LKPESKFWKEWKAFTPNILVKSLASSISKLYEGKNIFQELAANSVACSLMLAAWGLTLAACTLSSLELEACLLDACGL
jgi:hypothetical protein